MGQHLKVKSGMAGKVGPHYRCHARHCYEGEIYSCAEYDKFLQWQRNHGHGDVESLTMTDYQTQKKGKK